MHTQPQSNQFLLLRVATFLLLVWLPVVVRAAEACPPPGNDNCASAENIVISNGGFSYGLFTSGTFDMATATAQAGEYFAFAPNYNHSKSIWYQFTLPTHRSVSIEIAAGTGSVFPTPESAGVTVYSANANCLPGVANNPSSFISSGLVTNSCLEAGTYLIQVTGIGSLAASVYVNLTLGCPDDPINSPYDCHAEAFMFNGGSPLPGQVASGVHKIGCHSIEDPTEYTCLPVANKADFIKSAWYVFTTGSDVDLLSFDFNVNAVGDEVCYRLLEGNVRSQAPNSLAQIECGLTSAIGTQRFLELPCVLQPNTTYSLALLFDRSYHYDDMNINARQRGVLPSGWPRPVLPPVNSANQLGNLVGTPAGALNLWSDNLECNSYIIDNPCPPANPASGQIAITTTETRNFDLATWATFTLTTDANVSFGYSVFQSSASYHTRIYSGTLGAACPSPGPADLYYQFSGRNGSVKCMPAGDYSIQVLSSSADPLPPTGQYQNAWTYGALGTRFTFQINVVSLPSSGLFRLHAPGEYNAINNLAPMQQNVLYNSVAAVFTCENTVLPDNALCTGLRKAMYREVNIGDANGDGVLDTGLLTITRLRTDIGADPPIHYGLYRGDANQLATDAGTHTESQRIAGLTDHAGFCITEDDITENPPGIDNFCACVNPGIYTLASFGDIDHAAKGDNPSFRFTSLKTTHYDRPHAELIPVAGMGTYVSGLDFFSCTDNIGDLPPCGNATKVVFREFFLAEETVISIREIGNPRSVLSLFAGRASDLSVDLVLHTPCFRSQNFIDPCTPLEPGWYTIVSYGSGPNNTGQYVSNEIGFREDVGSITQVEVSLVPPIEPNYNRPYKAHPGGITDWVSPTPADPNIVTGRFHHFLRDTFCNPDTPFIPTQLMPCGPGYNRIAFYVFEITKQSFVQIHNIDVTFYTAVFPFDVREDSASLLTVSPVYPCVRSGLFTRQLCDLPPGKYTIAIFANDSHKGDWISPSIWVDEAEESRFDHIWKSYDFDVIPANNTFVNGKALDTNPDWPGQAPSRDIFYCTTGATVDDPTETQCRTQLNDNIYAQPPGVPKPLFLTGNPAAPQQPWRTLWYSFVLTGSGICTIESEVLAGVSGQKPLLAVYESDADGHLPWTDVQTILETPGNPILSGLTLIREQVSPWCNAELGNIVFTKSGCIRDSVRYYIAVAFDADSVPNYPNQTIAMSIKYDGKPYFAALYDERPDANVINGLGETAPPYTTVPIMPGNTFTSVDFSLLCYTRNATDPGGCVGSSGKSAWFKFDVAKSGQLNLALEKVGLPNQWYYNLIDITVWRDPAPNTTLVDRLTMKFDFDTGPHPWQISCIEPGSYYLLIRHCVNIDTLQHYRLVMAMTDSPGDLCSNAIPVVVQNTLPQSGATLVNCHSIGTDNGEMLGIGNPCFNINKRKTTWYKATVDAGPMMDLNFTLSEDFDNNTTLNDLSYRILAGTCGAMTPIACSAAGSNVLTLNCLGPGDYYVQVSVPETTDNSAVNGELELTVTATPSNPVNCTEPFDPDEVLAEFTYSSDCQEVAFFNNSTAGTDITYLWEFPDGTSTEMNPVWIPPVGSGTYSITLTVTNTVNGNTATIVIPIDANGGLSGYTDMRDTMVCNSGSVMLDASLPGATFEWDNGSNDPQRAVTQAGTYWVVITKEGCEIRDTVVVDAIQAVRAISEVLCPDESMNVEGTVFDINHPDGTVTIPDAHPSGCDSIISVSLAFHSIDTTKLTAVICDGETLDFEGQQLTQTGNYSATQTASTGCDSIVTMALTVTPTEVHDHDISGCTGLTLELSPFIEGASYTWEGGEVSPTLDVITDGTYVLSVSDANGCLISVESFAVVFGELAIPDVIIPEFVCEETDVIVSASGSSGIYQWFDHVTGGSLIGAGGSLSITNVVGDTTVFVQALQIVDEDTCVSQRVPAAVLVTDLPTEEATVDTVVCEGIQFALPWGETVTIHTDSSFNNTWYYVESGCDSAYLTINALVENATLQVEIDSLYKLHLGDSVYLDPQLTFVTDSVIWLPGFGLACDTCLQTWAKPGLTTEYDLLVWSEAGCLVTAYVKIELSRDIRIYIPNVFTPNGDNINDLFTVFAKPEVANINKLIIYDRWGEELWRGLDFLPNGTMGWDGTFRDQPMSPGVFAWLCEVKLIDGTTEVLSGDLTLIR